jgi:hypothetical protein
MAKVILELEEDYSYHILGLVATAKPYRICWAVNRLFHLELKRREDIEIYSKRGESRYHAFFAYYDEALHTKYRLIQNKNGVSLFLPEVNNADFLLVTDKNEHDSADDQRKELKKLPMVQMVFGINPEELKMKQNILLAA